MKFDEFRKKIEIKASVSQKKYVIGKLNDCPETPEKVFAVIKEGREITVVAEENHGLETIEEEKFFRIISFETKLPFELVGFLAHIATILAEKDISIFAISAYSTDHVLVREKDLEKTLKILRIDGIKISGKI
jgi:hypothetical protein